MTTKSEAKQALKLDAYGYEERGAPARLEDAHGLDVASGCFVVADGVGQGLGGGRAATFVARHVLESCVSHAAPMAALRHAMSVSAATVRQLQEAHRKPAGTTVAALLLREGRAFVAWCGDSRVYRLRREQVLEKVAEVRPELLTYDHRHADGGLIRWLGSRRGGEDSITPEYRETDVQPGDVFALVTDGVWEALGDEGVTRTMADAYPALNARWVAEELVHRALERGSQDNLTAVVVQVRHG